MLRAFFILLVASVLAGCQTLTAADPKSEGLVVAKMTSNASLFKPLAFSENSINFEYWDRLGFENMETGGKYSIYHSESHIQNSAIYMGGLPPGTYKLTQASTYKPGYIDITQTLSIPDGLGSFTVEAGQVTDLGHLVYLSAGIDRGYIVRGDLSYDWLSSYLNHHYPEQVHSFLEQPYLNWNPSGNDMELARLYKAALAMPSGLFYPKDTEEGTLLFGTMFGSIKEWSPVKGMRVIHTGVEAAISAIEVIDNSTWVVAGENGQIKITQNKGKTWSDFNESFDARSVVSLNFYNNSLFVTLSDRKKISIFESELSSRNWKHVFSFDVDINTEFFVALKKTNTLIFGKNLVTSVPYSDVLLVTSLDDFETSEVVIPSNVLDMRVDGQGRLLVKTFSVLDRHGLYESKDMGLSWNEIKADSDLSIPYYIDEKVGFSLDLNGAMVSVLVGETPSLVATNDGGTTWSKLLDTPITPPVLGEIRASGYLYLVDINGAILLSKDRGKNWRWVYPN